MKNNIGLLLAKRAYLNPDLEAVYDARLERRFTYSEANRRCNATAICCSARACRGGSEWLCCR